MLVIQYAVAPRSISVKRNNNTPPTTNKIMSLVCLCLFDHAPTLFGSSARAVKYKNCFE